MDFLAVHNAYAPVLIGVKDVADPREVYRTMLAAPVLVESNLAQVSELLLQALALDSLVLICIVTRADDRAGHLGDLRGVGSEPGHARPGVAADAVRDRPVAGHQLAPFARTGGAVEVPVA